MHPHDQTAIEMALKVVETGQAYGMHIPFISDGGTVRITAEWVPVDMELERSIMQREELNA